MTTRHHQAIACLIAALTTASPAEPWTSDIVGYTNWVIPPHSTRLMGLCFINSSTVGGTVTEVGPDYVRATGWIVPDPLGDAGSAMVRFRSGTLPGLTIPLTGITDNNRVGLLRSPEDGLVQEGDYFTIHPDWTMEQLLGLDNRYGLQEGGDPETADTISLWDPVTQSSDVYYFKTGEGLRKAGHEAAGDQSQAVVPALSGLIITRRGDTELKIIVSGEVPSPLDQGVVWVVPGRNIFSPPFTNAGQLSNLFVDPPSAPDSAFNTIAAGPAAPMADTLRYTSDEGIESPLLYYRYSPGMPDHGWRAVGEDGDAGDTPIDLINGIDFHRAGPPSYLTIRGVVVPEPSRLLLAGDPTQIVPVDRITPEKDGLRIEWKSTGPDTSYQLQTTAIGGSAWQDLGDPVIATSDRCSTKCSPGGTGQLRIVVR